MKKLICTCGCGEFVGYGEITPETIPNSTNTMTIDGNSTVIIRIKCKDCDKLIAIQQQKLSEVAC